MNKKIEPLITQAKAFLTQQQYDAAHDLNHHESVWKTAQEIVDKIEDKADRDLLHVACLWHDVLIKPYSPEIHKDHKKVTLETAEYVRQLMTKSGFSDDEAEVVYLAIRYHEFDDKPKNVEGKILFDADKLDVLSIERVRRFVQSDQAGKVPGWKLQSAIFGAQVFLKQMRKKFQFAYSRKLFDRKIVTFLDDPEIKEYATKYGINLDKLKSDIQKTTLLDEVLGWF